MDRENIPSGFKDVLDFKFVDPLFGRRTLNFFMDLDSGRILLKYHYYSKCHYFTHFHFYQA